MEPRKFYSLFILIAIPVVIISVVLFAFYRPRTSSPENTPTSSQGSQGNAPGELSLPQAPAPPTISLVKKDKNTLLVSCANLPNGTTDIRIFRSKIGKNLWVLWKTQVVFPKCTTEVVEIKIIGKDDLSAYEYYFEAVSESNMPLWLSSRIVPQEETLPSASPATSSTGNQTPSQTGSTGSAQEPPAASPQNTGGQSGSQTGSSTVTSGGTVYYTPSGEISGVIAPPTQNFRVIHVDNRIEIGWQLIPERTTKAVVYRARSLDGVWEKLFEQTSPISPYLIRIFDDTLNELYYYRLDTLENATLLETYGPVLLQPLVR